MQSQNTRFDLFRSEKRQPKSDIKALRDPFQRALAEVHCHLSVVQIMIHCRCIDIWCTGLCPPLTSALERNMTKHKWHFGHGETISTSGTTVGPLSGSYLEVFLYEAWDSWMKVMIALVGWEQRGTRVSSHHPRSWAQGIVIVDESLVTLTHSIGVLDLLVLLSSDLSGSFHAIQE